jgi:V/A-type H+-transporting ATPase subunit E
VAVEDIFRALEAEGEKESKEVLARAKEQAEKVVEEAEEESRRIAQDKIDKVCASLQGEQAQILNSARLKQIKETTSRKEALIRRAFDEAKAHLNVRDRADYPEIFEMLAKEAIGLRPGKVRVYVDPRDAQVAQAVLPRVCDDFELYTELECLGGLRVTTEDGRVTHLNTVDSRLEKARSALKSKVASILFG